MDSTSDDSKREVDMAMDMLADQDIPINLRSTGFAHSRGDEESGGGVIETTTSHHHHYIPKTPEKIMKREPSVQSIKKASK